MYELHHLEQYFFDPPTISHLADFTSRYENLCCLCAPLIGEELEQRGARVTTLDVDERFAHLSSFRKYDLFRPEWLGEAFDLILCDPPFFRVSLSQLFTAIRLLSRYDYGQPLLIAYLTRRGANVLGTFARFNLESTDYRPGYVTVQPTERNDIVFYGNLGREAHTRLAAIE